MSECTYRMEAELGASRKPTLSRYEERIDECFLTLGAGSDWRSVSTDSNDRGPCSQISAGGHPENSSGVLLRVFLGEKFFDGLKSGSRWQEFDSIVRHLIAPSGSRCCEAINHPQDRTFQRHVLGMAVHRWKVGKYRRLWHSTHTPGHRNRRGRTTVSTQPSGGNALNWSLLHWRQWTDKKCIIGGLRPVPESATFQCELIVLPVAVALASAGVSSEGSHPVKPLMHAR